MVLCRLARYALFAPALLVVGGAALAQTIPAAPPLHIGVGGDYPDGADGLLLSRGLPHERVFAWELGDLEALKRYEVLLLCCPVSTKGYLDPALTEWLRQGGRAYVEIWAGLQGPWPLSQLVGDAGRAPDKADVLPGGADHPITANLDPSLAIDLFHLMGNFLQPRQPNQTTPLGYFCPDGGGAPWKRSPAVVCMPVGAGELVYSGAPLTFSRFHRGPSTEPLMNAIIDHLAQGRAVSRLSVSGLAGTPGAEPGLPGTVDAEPQGAAPPPTGFEVLDSAAGGSYNLTAQAAATPGASDEPAVLALDAQFSPNGKPLAPCLWLSITRNRLELRRGHTANAAPVASASWHAPAEPAELLVRRRPGMVVVVLGERELLVTKTDLKPGGSVALRPGAVALADAVCQTVGEPVFSDDFMREAGDPDPWTTVSGRWRQVGLGHEEQSVNGFYYRGRSAEAALATTGSAWWEDYVCSVSVGLEDAATCGVCVLQRGDESVAFLADSSARPEASLRLVQVRAGAETVMAQTPGSLAPRQWYRLAVRLSGGRIEALVDGEPVLTCAHQEPRGGGVGLLVRGGAARFDDVLVRPSSEPLRLPRNEGTPMPEVPTTLGPQDQLTWANPAAHWSACPERPSLLWHTGSFSSEVTFSLQLGPVSTPAARRLVLAESAAAEEPAWYSVTAQLEPDKPAMPLLFTRPGAQPVKRQVSLGDGGTLQLVRRGDAVAVLWNGAVIFRTAQGGRPLRRLGVEVDGPPVPAESLAVRAPGTRDYVFGVAPSDWWISSGTWEVASRWACDNRWSWFAGWGNGDFAVWNKHPVEGDVVMDYYAGVKMEAPGGPETVRCRDLNSVLCGDRANPHGGYSFVLGGDGGVKTQLFRQGVVVAEAPQIRVPTGWGIHHEWFHIRVARVGSEISLDFEDRPVLHYTDPDPLPGGHVGLWSRNSGILVPRVTVFR